MPTQIVCAYEDDAHPVMQLWDLRSPSTYIHEYAGHHKASALESRLITQQACQFQSCKAVRKLQHGFKHYLSMAWVCETHLPAVDSPLIARGEREKKHMIPPSRE